MGAPSDRVQHGAAHAADARRHAAGHARAGTGRRTLPGGSRLCVGAASCLLGLGAAPCLPTSPNLRRQTRTPWWVPPLARLVWARSPRA